MDDERYEDQLARSERERTERQRVTPPAPEPVVAGPTLGEQRRESLTVRSGDDVERALDKIMQVTPPGVAIQVVEQAAPSSDGWFPITAARARQLDGYTVTSGGVGETYRAQRADASGRPVAASGWSFPSLSDLHISRRE